MENNSRKPREYKRVSYINGGDVIYNEKAYRSYGNLVIMSRPDIYYEKYQVKGLFGYVTMRERKERQQPLKVLPTYVEKIGDRYYDIITNTEVFKFDRLNYRLQFCEELYVKSDEVYNFLVSLDKEDIAWYRCKFNDAVENAKSIYIKRMAEIRREEKKQMAQEDYISKFRESSSTQKKTR